MFSWSFLSLFLSLVCLRILLYVCRCRLQQCCLEGMCVCLRALAGGDLTGILSLSYHFGERYFCSVFCDAPVWTRDFPVISCRLQPLLDVSLFLAQQCCLLFEIGIHLSTGVGEPMWSARKHLARLIIGFRFFGSLFGSFSVCFLFFFFWAVSCRLQILFAVLRLSLSFSEVLSAVDVCCVVGGVLLEEEDI